MELVHLLADIFFIQGEQKFGSLRRYANRVEQVQRFTRRIIAQERQKSSFVANILPIKKNNFGFTSYLWH